MTEDGSNPEQIEEYTPGPGERLRRVRESKRLSLRDVCQEMHIDEHIINDLEHDRYDEYEPIFISGYLRKYAKLLDLPGDALVANYKRVSNRKPPELSATVKHRQVRSDHKLFLYATYLIAAVFIGMLVAWWLGHIETDLLPPTAEPVAEVPAEITGAESATAGMPEPELQQPVVEIAEEAVVQQAADMPEATAGSITDAAPLVEDTPESVPPAENAGLPERVILNFREDSWAEVTDAEGQRKLFGLYKRGQVIEIEGAIPMEISLGNAAGVEITYNGSPYDFSADIRRTGTARFTVK